VVGIDTGVPLRIALVDMLEKGGAFLPVHFRRIGPWETAIERVLDDQLDLGTRGRLLAPIWYEQRLEPIEHGAGDLFDLGSLLGDQLGRGAGQDVEADELFLGQVFADMPFLLLGEAPGDLEELFQEFLDAPAAGVVAVDQGSLRLRVRKPGGRLPVGADFFG